MDAHDQAVGVELSLGETPGADPEELEQLSLSLRRELLALDEVDRVTQKSAGEPPAGTRAVDPVAIGALIVTVGKTTGALKSPGLGRDTVVGAPAGSNGENPTRRRHDRRKRRLLR